MSLFNIDISISEKRNSEVRFIILSENIKLSSSGTVYITSGDVHFFPSSFLIENNDIAIYIDPLEIESEKPADFILITHSHPDHFSLDDIKKIYYKKTVIICPRSVAKKLAGYNMNIVSPNDNIKFDSIQIDVVPAYSKGFPSHPKVSNNVGYVIEIDGVRIYHAGDTDLIKEISDLKSIDVALVPIDGGHLTMSTQEAAFLINKIKPIIAIPMHYLINMDKPNEFKGLIDKEIEVNILAD